MKTKDERQNYLLDFYPSEGAYFHCQLTAGNFKERQKKYAREQASFSQCPNPYSQCPHPYSQCPAPEAKSE
ncbi:MAG: hypothetical protein PVG35_21970 [Desulfobacterales bacterium]|jgi:hypothetical protein